MAWAPPPPPPPAIVAPATRKERRRRQCVLGAARYYGARPYVIRAVIRTEGGRTGHIRRNTNGTYDMGVMQINSIHLPELAKYGITAKDLIYNECLNIYIGTWYLRSRILARGDLWKGIGDYHSRTPSLNKRYQRKVYQALLTILEDGR